MLTLNIVQPATAAKLTGLSMIECFASLNAAHFDLELEVATDQKELRCKLLYSTDLFTEESISGMATHLQVSLGSSNLRR